MQNQMRENMLNYFEKSATETQNQVRQHICGKLDGESQNKNIMYGVVHSNLFSEKVKAQFTFVELVPIG